MADALTQVLLNREKDVVKADIASGITYGAFGTDDTTPTSADTALGDEIFRGTIDEVDSSGTSTVIISSRLLSTDANGNAIAEYGTFDAATGGSMFNRGTITTINKTSDIQIFIDTIFTVSVTEGS